MTKCENCGHEFHNVALYRDCPRCGRPLRASSSEPAKDDGFDATGFAFGMATGVPLSPTHGVSVGSMLGAAMHSNPSPASPSSDPAPSGREPDSSSSYSSSDSGSSYSSSDSGSSGGGSFGGC